MGTSQIRSGFISIISPVFLITLFSTSALSAPPVPVSFTILHTNDFHGQLEPSGSNPGSARVATVVNDVRTVVGAENVLLVDAGDEMQGSLLSNLGDGTPTGKGLPTIDVFNNMGYNVATFGNHEFDWGQTNLGNRTTQATYPFITANIVQNDTGNCATAGWTKPAFADAPYQVVTVGAPNAVKVAFIGVTTTETPYITIASATSGLCFKDPADSILHYYDAMKADGADVIVVLSHLGVEDGGYGYGIPVYGDKTLATKLNTAGKPANLIIGGHSHTDLTTETAPTVGTTKVVQSYYSGRRVGRADVTVGTEGSVNIVWSRLTVSTSGAETPAIKELITSYTSNPAYLALINQPIGYSAVDLSRNYNGDNMMGDFIDDAIYGYLNSDSEPDNDVDMFFNNPGGIRTDWCDLENPPGSGTYIWTSTAADCQATGLWTHDPMLLNYGHMFQILPFGNATIVGTMTGSQVLELLHQSATLFKGAIQPSGIRHSFYRYSDANPGPQPYAWGAFDVAVFNKTSHAWEPLDLKKSYRVGTNEFLAPAGQDGFTPFKYMTDITYWGDMLNHVNAYVTAHYGTIDTAYKGPDGDGTLDDRIIRDGNDTAGSIVPLTILHHNDSHGNLAKGIYVGYTQLATLIKQERVHNPNRTLLLSAGDNIQGDAMMYYFRTAPTGFASDGTPLAADLQYNPLIKAFNSMGYDAMTLGNHEFNFGSDVFKGVLGQAEFPLLMANVTDSGSYGLAATGPSGIQPYVTKTVGPENIKVAIMGIGNHRVPNYELPSNIPGLTFTNPLTKAQELSNTLRPANDVVIALTHIGFTENPQSVEVDTNVDTNLAATVTGLDAIIGGHSHTDATKQTSYSGAFKYLPAILAGPNNKPVVTSQAYRYNNTLGQVVLGLRAKGGGGYDVVSQTGRANYMISLSSVAEDPAVKAIADPFVAALTTYNNTVVGYSTAPIDALQAFTQETNGANLQADAAVYELEDKNHIPVDFHLAGAMTNRLTASGATPAAPIELKVSDMFSAMPYENSLVVVSMNGPQLKDVLERGYRNYYYYKYIPGYGGYSYYTTCMLDTDSSARIVYDDRYPTPPNGNNVVSLTVNGVPVDFGDAGTYYNVSTVNYLAAGSCNFNDSGVTLWPLNQITHDTQYYVRDAVIDYIAAHGTVSPAIEGRLTFTVSQYFRISGTLGPSGAGGTVVYSGGSTTADSVTGNYSFWVPSGWDGSAIPVKTGISFTPSYRIYTNVAADLSGQDYAVHPTITAISPTIGSAAGGTMVTVTGSNFTGTTSVKFDSISATGFTVNSPILITAISPAGTAGTDVHIRVTTPQGISATSSADRFSYVNVARNSNTGTVYATLASAITDANVGDEIRIVDAILAGDTILGKSLTLNGGWDTNFVSPGDDPTILKGNLTINGGNPSVRSLTVKGILGVHQGSLMVNGVIVAPN
jgi:2',3'-cyclic-nucleotide 2'-phosphodiesterase (5'-nucleotidase family)